MSALPSEIGNLVNLKCLSLLNNHFSALPLEIGNLVNLSNLIIENNKLTNLPAEIVNLVNLEYLFLKNNQFRSLPVEILKIKEKILINETSYEINNLSLDTEILIFRKLKSELTNLPITLKEI